MKRFFLFFIISFFSYAYNFAKVKALSIGISKYPKETEWNDINAYNDVILIKSLFPDANTIENSQATHNGIINAIKALQKSSNKGDTIIIHFSGHGQQILTHKSDSEIDKIDEAIVPYDAAKRKTAKYNGCNHYTDDDFGTEIEWLRKIVGKDGLVIVLIDACHSDSMDKTTDNCNEIYRGTNEIFGTESLTFEEITELKKSYHSQDSSNITCNNMLSDVIFISACRSNQRNYEIIINGLRYGSLTFYFFKAMKEHGLNDLNNLLLTTYNGMFNDKTLRFHGQLPSIRNTIGWVPPLNSNSTTPPIPNEINDSNSLSYITIITSIIGIALIIAIILWIIHKKK